MGAKKESTKLRNSALVEDAKAFQSAKKSPGFIVDKLMKRYEISFRTLTEILFASKVNLRT